MTRPRRSGALFTDLVSYLNDPDNWTEAVRLIPKLSQERLQQARNSKRGSEQNNDVLEFQGDRVVNLVCALVVAEDRFCSDHQLVVGRAVTNNDTLGRLAYQLQLQKHARLDLVDLVALADWDPKSLLSPPKALADLFEALTGAVHEEHGWDATADWLRDLFKPLIEKATADYVRDKTLSTNFIEDIYVSHRLLGGFGAQEKLLDYLAFKESALISLAEDAITMLPPNTKFIFSSNGVIGNDRDMVEIATHLVKYWICKIFLSLYPENRKAMLKGPHLISSLTTLVTNTWTLAYLGSMLSLSSFFDVDDADYLAHKKRLTSPKSATLETDRHEAPYRSKLTQALYAMIGWYHNKDAKAAEKWGMAWFKFIVIRAHDIIVDDPSYKPCLPYGADDTVAIHAAAVAALDKDADASSLTTEDLEARFSAMVLADKRTRKNKVEPKFKDAASHRLIIHLDEDEDEDEAEGEGTSETTSHGVAVEEITLVIQKLEIGTVKSTTGGITIATKKTMKINFHNDDSGRFRSMPGQEHIGDAETKIELEGTTTNNDSTTKQRHQLPINEPRVHPSQHRPPPASSGLTSRTTIAATSCDTKHSTAPDELQSVPGQTTLAPPGPGAALGSRLLNREPPREPRAMRKERKPLLPKAASSSTEDAPAKTGRAIDTWKENRRDSNRRQSGG